jgi:hypothetical protein
MKIVFKIPSALLHTAQTDLRRSHAFAYERIGFLVCKSSYSINGVLTIYAFDYVTVPDNYYIPDNTVGVRFGKEAIQQALVLAFNEGNQNVSVFHVHEHLGNSIPWFSHTDIESAKTFVPDIFNTAPKMPHGTLVLNEAHGAGLVWLGKTIKPQPIDTVISVGVPTIYSHYHERTLF